MKKILFCFELQEDNYTQITDTKQVHSFPKHIATTYFVKWSICICWWVSFSPKERGKGRFKLMTATSCGIVPSQLQYHWGFPTNRIIRAHTHFLIKYQSKHQNVKEGFLIQNIDSRKSKLERCRLKHHLLILFTSILCHKKSIIIWSNKPTSSNHVFTFLSLYILHHEHEIQY